MGLNHSWPDGGPNLTFDSQARKCALTLPPASPSGLSLPPPTSLSITSPQVPKGHSAPTVPIPAALRALWASFSVPGHPGGSAHQTDPKTVNTHGLWSHLFERPHAWSTHPLSSTLRGLFTLLTLRPIPSWKTAFFHGALLKVWLVGGRGGAWSSKKQYQQLNIGSFFPKVRAERGNLQSGHPRNACTKETLLDRGQRRPDDRVCILTKSKRGK